MKKNEKIDIIRTVTKYHEDLRGIGNIFLQCQSDLLGSDVDSAYKKLVTYFSTSLSTHFKFEEEIVFPSVLKYTKSSRLKSLINELIQEHKSFLVNIQKCISHLGNLENPKDPDVLMNMVSMLSDIGRKLLEHARLEDQHVVKLVEATDSIRILMGREYMKRNLSKKD